MKELAPESKPLTTRDPDAFRAGLRGFHGDMWCLHGHSSSSWQLFNLHLGALCIQHGHVGAPNMVMGEPLSNCGLLYLLSSGTGGSRFNGRMISQNHAVIFQPERDFVLSHDNPHEWCTIRSSVIHPCTGKDHNLIRDASQVKPLLDVILPVINTAMSAPGFTDSPAAGVAARILNVKIQKLLAPIAKPEEVVQTRGRPARHRRLILQACHDYLSVYDQTPISVNELAMACNVSARTLQSVFNDYFGFGPQKFLHFRQLYRVQRALKEADPKLTRVSDILLENGVWNFGHFCRRYKSLFSETPFQSLTRV